jgi:hypothetical protein
MKTRCKFRVNSVTRRGNSQYAYEDVEFDAVHGGTAENESFAAASPSGKLTISVTNPSIVGQFNPGEEYYLDITKA